MSYFLDPWKLTIVQMISEQIEKATRISYRTISLLPIMGKIFLKNDSDTITI